MNTMQHCGQLISLNSEIEPKNTQKFQWFWVQNKQRTQEFLSKFQTL